MYPSQSHSVRSIPMSLQSKIFPMTRMLGLALTIGSLAACMVGPDYARPDLKTHADYVEQSTLSSRLTTLPAPALDSWWAGFDDPELKRIIQRALAENLDLVASMARVDQARAAAREAGAQLAPQGSLD